MRFRDCDMGGYGKEARVFSRLEERDTPRIHFRGNPTFGTIESSLVKGGDG
jgi:hypothetical protein